MKKVYYLFLTLLLIVSFSWVGPLKVKAEDPEDPVTEPIEPTEEVGNLTLRLDCPAMMKKDSIVECTLYGDIANKTLKSLTAEINVSSSTSGSLVAVNKELTLNSSYEPGNNLIIGNKIQVTSMTTVADVTISLDNVQALDEEGNPFIVNNTIADTIRIASDDATLASIRVDGSEISGYRPGTERYSFSVNSARVNITANKSENAQTVTGTGTKNLTCGRNQVNIKVNAEDGTSKTYVLEITRTCNSDASLSGITLSSGSLSPSFDEDTLSYRVNVSKDIETISITGNAKDNTQTITGNVSNRNLEFGDNTFTITVTAQDSTKKTYTIVVNREDTRSNNANLQTLTLSAGRIDFQENVLEYSTRVLYEVTSIDVGALAYDAAAKIEITGNENLVVGNNVIEIKVTAENGTEQTYVINVNRLKEGETLGDNADIYSLAIENYELVFDKDTYHYELEIEDETSLNITVVMEDATSLYTISGNENLKNGSVITITTQSLDGTTKTYEIEIIKNSDLWIYLVGAGSILLALIVIIVIIVKASKNKNKGQALKKDKDLMDKVEKQLNSKKKTPAVEDIEVKEPVKPLDGQENVQPHEEEKVKTTPSKPIETKKVTRDEELLDEAMFGTKRIDLSKNNEVKFNNNFSNQDSFEKKDGFETTIKPNVFDNNYEAIPKEDFNETINRDSMVKPTVEPLPKEEEVRPTSNNNLGVNNSPYRTNSGPTTKICKICGHRIPVELKQCPYCRNKF